MREVLKFTISGHLINACPAGFQTSGSMCKHTSARLESTGVHKMDREHSGAICKCSMGVCSSSLTEGTV